MSGTPSYGELKARVAELERATLDSLEAESFLNRRIKELNCLYGVSHIVERYQSLPEILQKTTDLISDSWPFYDVAMVRIRVKDQVYHTQNGCKTPCRQCPLPFLEQPILFHEAPVGGIKICRAAANREDEIESFQKEAQNLVHAIAERLGRVVERLTSEEALRNSEERFRRLAENSPDMLYRMALPEGIYEYVSPSAEEIFGYPPKDWYENPVLIGKLIHPDWQDYFKDQWQILLKGHVPPFYEYQIIHRDGEIRWINQRNMAVKNDDGLLVAIEAVVTDVTDVKGVQEELRESEAFLDTLINAIPIPLFYKDADGKYIGFNKAFEQFFGEKRERIIGKSARDISPGELAQTYHEKDGELLERGGIQQYESQVKNAKGELRDVLFNKATFNDENGRTKGLIGTILDITERKKTEIELRKSEQKYRALFNEMPSGVAVYEAINEGEDFVFKDFNSAAERIEGIRKEAIMGNSVLEAFPGVKKFGAFGVFQKVWKTGRAEFFPEAAYKDDRGRDSWRESWVYKLPSGEIVAVYNDVTERKRSEEKLRRSELRFQLLVQAINDVFWMSTTGVSKMIYISPAYETIWERSRESLYNAPKSFLEALHPDDRDEYKNVVDTFHNNHKSYESEYRIIRSDGSVVWIREKGYPVPGLFDGDRIMAGLCVDITALKRTERNLRRSQVRLASLVENLFDAILVTDLNGTIKFANHAASLLFGIEKERLIGTLLGLAVSLEEMFEITTNPPDGKERHAEARATMTDWDGVQAYLISLRDTTENRQAKRKQEEMKRQLQQMQKIEAIGTLAGGVAHDFNNMLSLILGYGQDLVDSLHRGDPLRESAKEIVEAGKRSASLTRQLLAFSRKQTLQPQVLDLNAVVTNVTNVINRLIGEDIELKVLPADKIDLVEVDPGQVEQIIMNLSVNARDAMPTGGKLTIETMNVHLDQPYADNHIDVVPGNYAMLSVTDNGAGMDEETRSRIFEPFFTTKEHGKGTGLGLSTVYGIVKQSGGNIWVYSEPGRGTTFKIYFPKTTKETALEKTDKERNALECKGESILVVEDESSLRKLCVKFLESLGYNVTAAANGGEALLLIEEKGFRPDLIITDVVMPEMSGKVLVDRLKKNLSHIKVLYMSGYTDNAIVHHGVLDSGAPFIQKPFGKEKLGETLRKILDAS